MRVCELIELLEMMPKHLDGGVITEPDDIHGDNPYWVEDVVDGKTDEGRDMAVLLCP